MKKVTRRKLTKGCRGAVLHRDDIAEALRELGMTLCESTVSSGRHWRHLHWQARRGRTIVLDFWASNGKWRNPQTGASGFCEPEKLPAMAAEALAELQGATAAGG